MCYRKQKCWMLCPHTVVEETECETQHRLRQEHHQQRLNGTAHTSKPKQRSSWLSIFCMPCFGPSSPPPSPTTTPPTVRGCRTRDVTVEIAGKCPRCRLKEAADKNHRNRSVDDDEDTPALRRDPRRQGFIGDKNLHVEGYLNANGTAAEHGKRSSRREDGYQKNPVAGMRQAGTAVGSHPIVPCQIKIPDRTAELRRLRREQRTVTPSDTHPPPQQQIPTTTTNGKKPGGPSVPQKAYIAGNPSGSDMSRASTAHLIPSPLRVSEAKRNRDLARSSNNSKKGKGKLSAVAGLENPPMSVLVEDEEETWHPEGEQPDYSSDLPLDELFEEVELMWQMGGNQPQTG